MPSPLTQEAYIDRLQKILEMAAADFSFQENTGRFIEKLPSNLRHIYGGNTTCAEIESDAGQVAIIDAGTGIVNLGDNLMKGPCGKGQGQLTLFFTHTHWDHIQGLPFFKPMYVPGNKLHFVSALPDLEARLVSQMQSEFFPLPFHQTLSSKTFTTLGQEDFNFFGITVSICQLRHPGGSVAYRFKSKKRVFIFATDAEFTGKDVEEKSPYDDFFLNADALVLDAQYTLDDHFNKFDWGHTSQSMAVNCASKWKIRHLILTHHEPSYPDDRLYENYRAALEHKNYLNDDRLQIHLGREGMVIRLPD